MFFLLKMIGRRSYFVVPSDIQHLLQVCILYQYFYHNLFNLFIIFWCVLFPFKNFLQVVNKTFLIHMNCLQSNTLDRMILCFHYSILHIYYLSLLIKELHEIFHLLLFFLPFVAYQHWLLILILFQYFSSLLAMLILVLIKSILDQIYMFQCILFWKLSNISAKSNL